MLKIENLSLQKGDFSLNISDIEIKNKSYFVILGKTGSGKTMFLESIAGLQKIKGSICCDGVDITNHCPEDRKFGFVYQDFMLFENMNVRDNIIFASRFKKIKNQDEFLDDLMSFLHIEHLLKREIKNLSGGEKQRVAIARAIFSQPKLLLLDEPLSAIDPTFRNQIMKSLKQIVQKYNISIIHVTHNFREASYLADDIAIIIDGKILQVGGKDDVLNNPKNIEVAKFLGFKNIIPSYLLEKSQDNIFWTIDPSFINFSKSHNEHQDTYCFKCTIKDIVNIYDHYKIYVKVDDVIFFAKVSKDSSKEFPFIENTECFMSIKKKDMVFL